MLVGASRKPQSVGSAILRNLIAGKPQFAIHAVNPHRLNVEGASWSPAVEAVPEPCDLAIVAVPPSQIPAVLRSLGNKGTHLAVIISAGLNDENGLKTQMMEAAREASIRLIGPNCLGVLVPRVGLNGSFATTNALPGKLAFLSQSGALATAILDWAQTRQIGFSAVLSVGDMADMGLGELITLLADDPETSAILIYLEGLTDGQAFLTAARSARTRKPIIALKAGRTSAAARAAKSHTGALAGAYDVYRSAFRQEGIVLVETLEELFDAAAVLGRVPLPRGDRLAIVTNGGGAGILAVDALASLPGKLAALSDDTLRKMDATLPASWSHANPVDIIGDAPPDRYRDAIEAVLADEGVDALLVMNCPTALADGASVVCATIETVRKANSGKPVLACWLGENNPRMAREGFAAGGIALFETPDEAIRGFSYLVQARDGGGVRAPEPRPISDTVLAKARHLVSDVRSDNRTVMSELEAKTLLRLFGVPVVPTRQIETPQAAMIACAELKAPYALKIVSPDLTHKSDIGGVVLGLSDANAVRTAAEAMLRHIRAGHPEARIQGFSVQPMIARKQAHELFGGIAMDPTFGPVVMVGAGGTAIEVLADRSIRLPPFDRAEAEKMLGETRISRLLAGYRDVAATKREAILDVLLALSDIALALPEVAELDINPMLANAEGVIALDARVLLRAH
jgi:acetyltransferase